ncbi:MAG: amidohydrolase family protein, partial [Anaerolineaceae bacterium]|nr:amidohydrolase family protein [Anaerolineaceae bacterium]
MQVLNNAKIYTFDPYQPQAEALAIENGRILVVGSDEEVRALAHHNTKWTDLEGRTILPGLTDSHIHLENYALGLQRVDCETQSRADCLRRVQQKALKSTAGDWVRGHGWNQNLWSDGFGCAAELDAVAPANPVYLTAKSLHAAWVNTRALELAGITPETPDPPGGIIDRDPAGKPTGILFETAMQLVERSIPEPAVSEVTACL